MVIKKALMGLMAAAAVAIVSPASAQAEYPTDTVRVIVPFAPGGGNDYVARVVMDHLSEELGQSFVVENMPGANAALGLQALTRSEPDGYTLAVTADSTLVINPVLRDDLPYEPTESFRPIANLALGHLVLVAHPSLGVDNLTDFLALAEEQPGTIRFGTAGIGNITHLAVERFIALTGIDLVHIPYDGMGPATTGLLSGDVQFGAYTIQSMVGQIEAGDVIPLAVGEPMDALPDLPNYEDVGLPDYEAYAWIGLFAPAGTPDEVIHTLGEAVETVLQDEELIKRLADGGWVPHFLTSEEVSDLIVSDHERWRTIITDANITVD